MKPKALSSLETTLSYSFNNIKLLRQALTHRSYINETKEADRKDNERLEFLGDAVLDLVMCQDLIERFPGVPEGDLSKMKAKIVSEETLASVARKIDLGAYLYLGKGEVQTAGQEKPSLLSDALEALIAAIYLDGGNQGLDAARRVILVLFKTALNALRRGAVHFDHKTALQEYSQQAFGSLPVYEVIQESGPDHEKRFEIKVIVNEEIAGMGIGKSKKSAEQKAAQAALSILEGES